MGLRWETGRGGGRRISLTPLSSHQPCGQVACCPAKLLTYTRTAQVQSTSCNKIQLYSTQRLLGWGSQAPR